MMLSAKEARVAAGMTQEYLARKLGMSQTAISLYELGKRTPSFTMAKKIAEVLDVPLADIYFGRGGGVMNFTTKELAHELITRPGVEKITVEPYEDKVIKVNGPAVILIIND